MCIIQSKGTKSAIKGPFLFLLSRVHTSLRILIIFYFIFFIFCANVWIFKLEDLTHDSSIVAFLFGDCRNIWVGYQHHKETSWRRARQNNPRERHNCMWLFLCLELLERNINLFWISTSCWWLYGLFRWLGNLVSLPRTILPMFRKLVLKL